MLTWAAAASRPEAETPPPSRSCRRRNRRDLRHPDHRAPTKGGRRSSDPTELPGNDRESEGQTSDRRPCGSSDCGRRRGRRYRSDRRRGTPCRTIREPNRSARQAIRLSVIRAFRRTHDAVGSRARRDRRPLDRRARPKGERSVGFPAGRPDCRIDDRRRDGGALLHGSRNRRDRSDERVERRWGECAATSRRRGSRRLRCPRSRSSRRKRLGRWGWPGRSRQAPSATYRESS